MGKLALVPGLPQGLHWVDSLSQHGRGGADALRRVLWVLSIAVSAMSWPVWSARTEDALLVVAKERDAGVVVFLGSLCAGPGLEASPTLTPRSGCIDRCLTYGMRRCKRIWQEANHTTCKRIIFPHVRGLQINVCNCGDINCNASHECALSHVSTLQSNTSWGTIWCHQLCQRKRVAGCV
eukprot:3423998-Amphidinium_carterae.3